MGLENLFSFGKKKESYSPEEEAWRAERALEDMKRLQRDAEVLQDMPPRVQMGIDPLKESDGDTSHIQKPH